MANIKISTYIFALILAVCLISKIQAKSLANEVPDKGILYGDELDLVDDDGSAETALLNYLFARKMVNRLRQNLDVRDLQRKRSYWKQCAFNAVSCFGK